MIAYCISIHDLTRRSTLIRIRKNLPGRISIHDLTRRSTQRRLQRHLRHLFQFTTSQGGRRKRRVIPSSSKCISIHDLTRRSTLSHISSHYRVYISIHDLTRRSTNPCCHCYNSFLFQFTTSQGGRHRENIEASQEAIFQFTTSQGGRQWNKKGG